MQKDYYHKEWYDWRDAVLRYVRFRPDHEAVAKELYHHYEDSVLDFERIGYEEKLARERALQAMGDPVEVGKGLDKAHKPWLGWLQKATEWTAFALTLMLAVTLMKDWWLVEIYWHMEDQLKWQEPPSYAAKAETEHGTIYMVPGEPWADGDQTYQRVNLWLEFDTPQATRPDGLWQLATFTTDRGEIRARSRLHDELGDWPESWYYDHVASTDFYALDGYTRYQWSVRFVTEEPLEWVEMRYPYYDWVLRAEWEVAE